MYTVYTVYHKKSSKIIAIFNIEIFRVITVIKYTYVDY